MRTSLRWSVLAVLAVTGGSLGGCGGCGSKSGGGATSSSAPLASVSAPAGSGGAGSRSRTAAIRASGVTGAIFRAVHGLELKPAQKTELDKIGTDYREAEKTARGEGDARKNEAKELQTALAAGVKAGKLDTPKLDGIQAELEKAAKGRHDREADVLNKVHAVLDPAQRSATAATVRGQEERRNARLKPGDGGAAKGGDGGRPPMNVGGVRFRLERYTKDLDLDAEQRKKVDAILPKDDPKAADELRDEAKKRSDALLAAFEKEPFDAKKLEADAAAKKPPAPMAESVKFLGQLIPILKPEQRDKLAATLEKDRGGGHSGDDHRRHRWPDRGHDAPEDDDEAD